MTPCLNVSKRFGAKNLGPFINAHSISLVVPKNTDLNRTPIKFNGYLIAYWIAKVAPHDPPTMINLLIFKNSLIFSMSSIKFCVLFPNSYLYGLLLPQPL